MRILAFAFALPLLVVAGVSKAETFTGCLASGNINKVAISLTPKSPCTGNSQQISWNAEGPQGEQGEDGEQGMQGIQGEPGAGCIWYWTRQLVAEARPRVLATNSPGS